MARIQDPDERYEDAGVLGEGGMGQVRAVQDLDLGRRSAMKIIMPELMEEPGAVARFIEEAQATAQLSHPGIVPVHELGQLPDGRWFFTMRLVEGQTLGSVLRQLHRASSAEAWGSAGPWTFRRVLDAFHGACEAVAYAHSRDVIHRDLKPANIMLGAFGEVQVMDWGLAKVLGSEGSAMPSVRTERSEDDELATQAGTVAGTPAYMAPEQARGQVERLGPQTDVYALGAVLYTILSGRPPFDGDPERVLQYVAMGMYTRLSQRQTPPLPAGLVEIVERALHLDPEIRYPDAAALASEVAAWLDGERRLEQARAIVEEARGLDPRVAAWRARAELLRAQAEQLLAEVPSWAPEEDKRAAWEIEDQAEALRRRIDKETLEVTQTLHSALKIAPDLVEAHVLLARHHRREHAEAEVRRDERAATRAAVELRAHARALPASHPERQEHLAWLEGDGALSLDTSPSGQEVRLLQFHRVGRRQVAEPVCSLGTTPLQGVELAMGSYLLEIGEGPVRYPLSIGRQEHHRPGVVELPGQLGPDDCFVPAGPFWSGGDDEALDPLPRRLLELPAFVIARFQVTHAQFLEFLNDLRATGQSEQAWLLQPRAASEHEQGAPVYGLGEQGFFLKPDEDGDVWESDWPVFQIDRQAALAYCFWRSRRDGLAWRLPSELEWEKAARGVDGRFFPWGDHLDPSWCCIRASHQGRPMPSGVDTYPLDRSVYGVRGMAGNVRDMCAEAWTKSGPELGDGGPPPPQAPGPGQRMVARGGRWSGHARAARICSRSGVPVTARLPNLGFRLARSL
jgi:formylglycine-generating enzyme required for sulfatase activity